jgi:hypothetical protein
MNTKIITIQIIISDEHLLKNLKIQSQAFIDTEQIQKFQNFSSNLLHS